VSTTARNAAVIEELTLDREPDGRLRVRWSVAGPSDQVELAIGRSAEGIDHQPATTVAADAGEAVLEAPPGTGRVFVSASAGGAGAAVAGERRILLAGPVNFRDLGGYPTADGRRVRWGRVFRADALVFTDEDLAVFGDLGIRTVYDLRSSFERDTTPNRFDQSAPPRVELLPLVSEDPSANPLDGFDSDNGENFLEHLYVNILERSAINFGRILSGLSQEQDLPAVFHCAAGKDRTGMVSSVLLSILGVDLEVILADYELTSQYRTTEHVQASVQRMGEVQNLAPEVVAGILRAPRWAMESALTKVGERYGGFDRYLTGPAGADPAVPDRLRKNLLRA
jgi:protein-tyrosine phosphatase